MKTTYVRDAWYVAAWTEELADGGVISVKILDQPIVIYRGTSGGLHALQDRCCHRGLPLSLGSREGDALRCGYHGFRFDKTGACTDIPGKDVIPPVVRVNRYAVAQRDSWIWVWMGDPDQADESLIPASWSLSDPDWVGRAGHVDYAAYYELLNDNLTDLSHLTYVHAKSFGAGSEWAKGSDTMEELPRGLRLQRWIVREGGSNASGGMVVDTWQSYDYLVPGILLMTNDMYPPGTATTVGLGPDPAQAMFRTVSWQAVTPLSSRHTRYFFGIAVQAGPQAELMADHGITVSRMAFEEDRITIEAQQRMLDLTGDQMILAGHDIAPIRFRRILNRLAGPELLAAGAAV